MNPFDLLVYGKSLYYNATVLAWDEMESRWILASVFGGFWGHRVDTRTQRVRPEDAAKFVSVQPRFTFLLDLKRKQFAEYGENEDRAPSISALSDRTRTHLGMKQTYSDELFRQRS